MATITKNKPNPREGRNLRRKSYIRNVRQSFLIVCEGENTEPDYFSAFRLTSAIVKIVGRGLNTIGLVQKTLIIVEDERKKGRVYDQIWVIFDKDDFPDEDFNNAIKLAESNGVRVAYSNQAFELWFLLHFNQINGELHRSLYAEKLSAALGFTYNKDAGTAALVYRQLISLQPQAIRNAKAIMTQMSDMTPAKAESSTTVYQLVEELNKYADQ